MFRTIFLPWLVIRDLERHILKSDAERDAAERRADKWMLHHGRAAADCTLIRQELEALKAKQPVHGARGRFVPKGQLEAVK